MDDDRLTLSPDYQPKSARPASRGGSKRWEKVEARLDKAAHAPDRDPYEDHSPARARPRARGFRLSLSWLIVIAAGLFVVGFAAAPYLAFRAVRSAAQFGDVQALQDLVDYNAVRESLRVQVRPAAAEKQPPADFLHDPLGALRRAWEPVSPQVDVNPFLTPEALAALAEGRGRAAPAPPEGGVYGGPLPRLLYGGFDRVRLGVADPARPARLTIFTFERRRLMDWRLVGVQLPQDGP